MIRRFLIALGFGAALLAAFPAFAQMRCGLHADVINGLERKYNEQPVGMGLSVDGHLVEIFSSANGSWTILVTQPGGISCFVAAGEDWERIEVAAPLLGLAL